MVETVHLLPPLAGPQSDPVIFGVADALARLFPVETSARAALDKAPREQIRAAVSDEPEEALAA